MVDLSMFIIALTVMLLATIYIYLLSAVDVIATENIKSDNVLYSRYIIEFPSEILWVTGKSYDLDISESSSFNSSHYGLALLVIQTVDGNIHTVDMTDTSVPDFSQSMNRSNISTFKVNASDDTGGPIITDLVNDSNYEIVLTTANGSLAIIDYRKALMVYNDSIKFSTQTQIVPYLRNLKEGGRSLLGVSENGTLLMIEPTIMNNQNDSSIASELAFKIIKTNFTNLLTDGQIVVNNMDNNNGNNNSWSNEVFILTDPVNSYPHGALGDIFEPTKLLLLEHFHDNNSKKDGAFCLKEMLKLPEGMEVFETIQPVIIEYINGTISSKGVALVASGTDVGSAAYIYDDDTSSILFSSKPIGQGFRWLLILGSAMVNNNQFMLVLNETPHLSGIVKFIDIVNNKTLSIDGFSAHDYGSRNVEMYAITDVDNDEQEEVIIPTLNKKKIAILSVFDNNDTVYVNENFELTDKLSSNIITLDINYDGYEDIIAGDRSGSLYIFTSQVKYKNQDIT